jgi:hypothetical protein
MEKARRSDVPERRIEWEEARDMIVRGSVLVVMYGGSSPDAMMWTIDGHVYVTQVPAAVIAAAVRVGGAQWKIAELLVD